MPKWTIERQFLVPHYQHVIVEAATVEGACALALSDDLDWSAEEGTRGPVQEDIECSHPTEIMRIIEGEHFTGNGYPDPYAEGAVQVAIPGTIGGDEGGES